MSQLGTRISGWLGDDLDIQAVPRDDAKNKISHENKISTEIQSGDASRPPQRTPTLGQIVAYFKYQSTKEMNRVDNTVTVTKFWQRNCGACPEPVEGSTSFATSRIYKTKRITSNPTHCDGSKTMKIQIANGRIKNTPG
jgi:hypothetical protein